MRNPKSKSNVERLHSNLILFKGSKNLMHVSRRIHLDIVQRFKSLVNTEYYILQCLYRKRSEVLNPAYILL